MQQTLRPYLATGFAIVSASAIIGATALAPVPPDVKAAVPPVQVSYQAVWLSANVEDAVNSLIFAATKAGVSVAELTAPLVAPILGVSNEQAEYSMALAFIGFAGPLISGGGAVGTALQNVIDSHGLSDHVTNLVGAPGTVIDGVVNGGYGPNLQSLLPIFPTEVVIPPGTPAPVIGIFAPGFINNPGFTYVPEAFGVGAKTGAGPTVTLLTPSTTSLLQQAVSFFVTGGLPPGLPTIGSTSKTADTQTLETADVKDADLGDPGSLPKKQRPLVKLNILKSNPIAQEKKDNGAAAVSAASDKHAPGVGKTPVRDLVKRVLGGKGSAKGADGGSNAKAKGADGGSNTKAKGADGGSNTKAKGADGGSNSK